MWRSDRVRRALLCAGVLAASSLAAAADAPGRNLLVNPGVEEFNGELPRGFSKVVYGAAPTIAADREVKAEGRQSMRIEVAQPSDAAVSQDVLVRPGGVYRFSGRVRTKDLKPEPSSWTYGTYQIQTPQGSLIARMRNHCDTTDWTEESVVFRAPADGKLHIVCFHVGFGKGTGVAWFDDLRLVEAPGADRLVVTPEPLSRRPISPMIYGNFMELLSDLVPSLWAEKLDVTSFEYLATPQERKLRESRFTFDAARDPKDRPWRGIGEPGRAKSAVDTHGPFNGNASMRIDLAAATEACVQSRVPLLAGKQCEPPPGTASIEAVAHGTVGTLAHGTVETLAHGTVEALAQATAGIAQDGIAVDRRVACKFVGHFRAAGEVRRVRVELLQGKEVLASADIDGLTGQWTRREVRLSPSRTVVDATFALRIDQPGSLWVDRVSLVPEDNVAGWRRDTVEAIRAMKPGILRFGGSIIEGYDWRSGIGPWERRVPFPNRYWGRVDPNFVGIDEFVAFCHAVEAEPLICVRWSGRTPRDTVEQIEYCNGGPDTPMGALRARNGHPAPYRVKYFQIGNEVGGPQYDESVAAFAQAMKRADPSIQVFASYISERILRTAAPWLDAVSPHHYDCANLEGTAASFDQYDDLLRRFARGRDIFLSVTEWNTTAGDWGLDRHRLWTLENGLACARYLNFCERRADSIRIACRSNLSNSYCSGIVQTNNHAWYGTPAYHISKLYAQRGGSRPLRLGDAATLLPVDVSASLSADGRRLSLAAVNPTKQAVELPIDLRAFRHVGAKAEVALIADADGARDPEAVNSFARPERIAARTSEFLGAGRQFTYRFAPLSITMLTLALEK